MDNSSGFFGHASSGGDSAVRNREQHSGMQSVQNLEAIINEGLRVALQEETPDQSLEVLLKYLGKALNGERTYIFEQNSSGGDDNMNGLRMGWNRKKRIFKTFRLRYAQAGIGILALESIS